MIRKYEDKDVEDVIEVWFKASSLAHPFLKPEFMEQEKKNVRNIYLPNTETWVFDGANGVAGFIAMMGNEVGAIFVNPESHGQGIGTKLMDLVAQIHRELEVEVFKENTIGRAFYDKYGFKFMRESLHEETNNKLLRLKFNR